MGVGEFGTTGGWAIKIKIVPAWSYDDEVIQMLLLLGLLLLLLLLLLLHVFNHVLLRGRGGPP